MHHSQTVMVPNIQVDLTPKPLLTVDEVQQIQRQKIASLVGHVFQLTYAAMFDSLIEEEKVNRCNGCAINHPSQRQHSCLMMDSEDGWFYYHDDVRDKINLNEVLKAADSICSVLGFKLGKSWEAYISELPKLPWTSVYLTSLELDSFGELVQSKQLQERILHALYYGPCGEESNAVKTCDEDMKVDLMEVKCPENVVRKEEELMELDNVINEIKTKVCF